MAANSLVHIIALTQDPTYQEQIRASATFTAFQILAQGLSNDSIVDNKRYRLANAVIQSGCQDQTGAPLLTSIALGIAAAPGFGFNENAVPPTAADGDINASMFANWSTLATVTQFDINQKNPG